MEIEKLQTFILEKLRKELPDWLSYHNVEHTEYVIRYAIELGEAENLPEADLKLLHTAAIMHDTGFLTTYAGHEEASCKIARQYLPEYGYDQESIEKVCGLVMSTKLPQSPFDLLSGILCDADLYYIGTDDYQVFANRLFRELKHQDETLTNDTWLRQQREFLRSHTYLTEAARVKLNSRKQSNIRKLQRQHFVYRVHNDYSISDILLMIIGVATATFALQGFLVPNKFFDGGVTGISLLAHEIYHIPLAFVIIAANLPFIIMSIYVASIRFAVKTLLCIILLGICLYYFPSYQITNDKLLVSIFGGFFLGVGIGLTMRAGCAVDGIEVLALYTWRHTSFTISEIVLALNIIIFSIAAFHSGVLVSMYSMITYFTASKTVDYIVEGIEAYTGVTIISANSERIKEKLVNEMGRGITIYKGERGFLPGKYEVHSEVDIIFTVITRLELRRLKNLVYAEDPKAFVFANTIKETAGGILKRRPTH
ncbi:MAG TPA: YitT family protein [Parafilimonas sp.]|nr:YitT family protein [Parafilimonas sp.]